MAEAQAHKLDALKIDRTVRRRGRRSRWLIPLLLVAVALIAALLVARRPPTVRVAEVREASPGEQQTELSAAGFVSSRRRSVLAPQVPGRLVEVLVEEGDAVRAGQVVARLDDRDARVALARVEAELAAAAERLAAAEARTSDARRDAERAEQLARQGIVTQESLENAQAAARSLAADRRAAAALLDAARQARKSAELQLAHTTVVAPFDGTVVRKLADVGAVLAPAAIEQANVGGIIELVDLGALEVEAEVSEEQLSRIQVGQPALVTLDAFPDEHFPATVRTVRPSIDRSKATAMVKVQFEPVPRGALPDMGAKVAFLSEALPPEALDAEETALRVPASAVVEGEGGTVLWVVQEGRLRREPVRVGERVGDEVVLEEGPPPGTQVVLAPEVRRLRPGRPVKLQEEGG